MATIGKAQISAAGKKQINRNAKAIVNGATDTKCCCGAEGQRWWPVIPCSTPLGAVSRTTDCVPSQPTAGSTIACIEPNPATPEEADALGFVWINDEKLAEILDELDLTLADLEGRDCSAGPVPPMWIIVRYKDACYRIPVRSGVSCPCCLHEDPESPGNFIGEACFYVEFPLWSFTSPVNPTGDRDASGDDFFVIGDSGENTCEASACLLGIGTAGFCDQDEDDNPDPPPNPDPQPLEGDPCECGDGVLTDTVTVTLVGGDIGCCFGAFTVDGLSGAVVTCKSAVGTCGPWIGTKGITLHSYSLGPCAGDVTVTRYYVRVVATFAFGTGWSVAADNRVTSVPPSASPGSNSHITDTPAGDCSGGTVNNTLSGCGFGTWRDGGTAVVAISPVPPP